MLILLPPSETKREGGDGQPLDFASLAHPELTARRRMVVRALQSLARDQDATAAALRLGRTQVAEGLRNRTLTASATMPVLDRYTGVLYDALGAGSMPTAHREFAGRHVAVHSALFGPVAALDPIPAYRLSHDSRLPGMTLRKHWADAVTTSLDRAVGVVLDLRSEAYVRLGPLPVREGSAYLRVVTESRDGRKRALSHFNKKSKGELARALVQQGVDFQSIAEVLEWAAGAGFQLRRGSAGELELVVDQIAGPRRT